MLRARIVVFSRYPTPGRAKTRLIPAIGAERAAALHRRLTERTLAAVRASGLTFELRCTGAPLAAFNAWLGPLTVVDQGGGGLGERLAAAGPPFPTLFIGSDAPALSPELLVEAASSLDHNPAVIGPAEDGGYWLLGLRTPCDAAFTGIPWGTDQVCAETVARLDAASMSPARLPVLADCDRPEDLTRWPELLT